MIIISFNKKDIVFKNLKDSYGCSILMAEYNDIGFKHFYNDKLPFSLWMAKRRLIRSISDLHPRHYINHSMIEKV